MTAKLTSDQTADGSDAKTTPQSAPGPRLTPLQSPYQRLSSALARSLKQLGFDPARIHVVAENPERQIPDPPAGQRQLIVTFDGSSVTITPRWKTPAPEATPAEGASRSGNGCATRRDYAAGDRGRDPIVVLEESLFSAGIDPSSISGRGKRGPAAFRESTSTSA